MIAKFKINAARFNKSMEMREIGIPCDSMEEVEFIKHRLTTELATKGLINDGETEGQKFTRILPAAQFMWIVVEAPTVLEPDPVELHRLTLN